MGKDYSKNCNIIFKVTTNKPKKPTRIPQNRDELMEAIEYDIFKKLTICRKISWDGKLIKK